MLHLIMFSEIYSYFFPIKESCKILSHETKTLFLFLFLYLFAFVLCAKVFFHFSFSNFHIDWISYTIFGPCYSVLACLCVWFHVNRFSILDEFLNTLKRSYSREQLRQVGMNIYIRLTITKQDGSHGGQHSTSKSILVPFALLWRIEILKCLMSFCSFN